MQTPKTRTCLTLGHHTFTLEVRYCCKKPSFWNRRRLSRPIRMARPHWFWRAGFSNELFCGFVERDQRARTITLRIEAAYAVSAFPITLTSYHSHQESKGSQRVKS